jgi:hypothetical protein
MLSGWWPIQARFWLEWGQRHCVPSFLAAHVVPLDIWYVFPVEACMSVPMLRFYPHRPAKPMRLEKYKEAWHLMRSHCP